MEQPSVTRVNYCRVHGWIEKRIHRYLLNLEGWVLNAFLDLPATPSIEAISVLNHWIYTNFPKRLRWTMWTELGELAQSGSTHPLFFQGKTQHNKGS